MPHGPTIENLTGQGLRYEFTQVFQQMFSDYERVVIRSEFTEGLSGSRVFLVRPVGKRGAERPTVVKIDEVDRIKREWQAYHDCVENKVGEAAGIRGEPVFPPGLLWGGLQYPMAGAGTFEITSLQKYYQTASVGDIQHVLENRLFRSLETLWKDNSKVEVEYFLQGRYDANLPSNLIIKKSTAPTTAAAIFLQPDDLRQKTVQPGDTVQLHGFRVYKINREANQLSLNMPEGSPFAYRLELKGVDDINRYLVGQTLQQPVLGVVQQTRADLLLAEAQKTFGDKLDFAAALLPTSRHGQLPNPLLNLSRILNTSFDAEVGYIHGDLNLENVLVETQNKNAFLIDFAMSRKDHILHDPLRMELAVITKLLPELLIQTGQAAENVISFYERLHCAVQQPNQVSTPTGLEKPFAILQMIRRVAQHHLHRTNNWSEYYYGLFIYLLGSLRFGDLDHLPTTPLPKQMAFWGAAAILRILQQPPNCADYPPPQTQTETAQPSSVNQSTPHNTTHFYGPVTGPIHTGSGNINIKSQQETASSTPALRYTPEARNTLRQILWDHFNLTEIRDLCFELDIDFENLSGSSKPDKIRELILYCERYGLSNKLVQAVYTLRPGNIWEPFK